jgi:tripartite-type tricarboxylate transporter receptor subunit TctC
MDRRSFLTGTAATAAAVLSREASAQDHFPSRPVTIINAFPPGGANDLVTRPIASALEPVLKQPVVVETKAGAGGQVGAQVGASAKPDGYTLLSHNNGISGYAEVDRLFGRQPKTTRADFIPLARLSADPVLVLVNAQQPYKTLEEFVADAKKRPEQIVYSSGGLYGATHLPVAMLEKAIGVSKMRHLPTAGGGPAITALLGNNAQMSVQTQSASLQHVKAGKLRALATFGAQRSKALPDVPTIKEKGYDLSYFLWVGLFLPKGVPGPIVTTLSKAIDQAAASPQFAAAVANIGLEGGYLNAADFAKFWEEDAKRSDEAVRSIGKVEG